MKKGTQAINTNISYESIDIINRLMTFHGFKHQKEAIEYALSFFDNINPDFNVMIVEEEALLVKNELIKKEIESNIAKYKDRKAIYEEEEKKQSEIRMKDAREYLKETIRTHQDEDLDKLLAKLHLRYNLSKDRLKNAYIELKKIINPDNRTETEKLIEEYNKRQKKE
jgi:hypothetical protein